MKRLGGIAGSSGWKAWIAVGLGRAAIGCRGHGFRVAIPAARLHFSALHGQQFRDRGVRHGQQVHRTDRGSGIEIEQVCEAIELASQSVGSIFLFMNGGARDPPLEGQPGGLVPRGPGGGADIYLLMYEGRFVEAADWTERAITDGTRSGLPEGLRANIGRFSA